MINWDDKTDDITKTVIENNTELGHNLVWFENNRNIEMFKVTHFINGKQIGPANYRKDVEGAMALVRLFSGDYADFYRGVA